jgi:hypothetical protein
VRSPVSVRAGPGGAGRGGLLGKGGVAVEGAGLGGVRYVCVCPRRAQRLGELVWAVACRGCPR